MVDSSQEPWSDGPNAPQIASWVYLAEKSYLAGQFMGAIAYGIIIILFFRCMGALLNPVNRRGRAVKWGLVVQTAVMFMLATTFSALGIGSQGIYYINDREFPGVNGAIPPGPYGYSVFAYTDAVNITPGILFLLNQWLADGFLLYRCYIIYSMNYRVIVFPCLVYLASVAMGIAFAYNAVSGGGTLYWSSSAANIISSYLIISLSLNVLLTLMIVTRLVLHSRDIRNAMGASVKTNELYKSIITILVESCALYGGASLVYIVTGHVKNGEISQIFKPVLAQTQVIAPFLVILRVANRSALTSNSVASGNLGSIRFRNRGQSTSDGGTLPDGDPMSSTETNGEDSGERGVMVEKAVGEAQMEGPSQT